MGEKSCCRTIDDHLRGLTDGFSVSDDTLRSVLYQAGVPSGMPLSELGGEEVALCEAHLYVWCLHLLPYSKNNTKDSDGGWEHTEGGYQILAADRDRWWRYLRWLCRRWGWPWLEELLKEERASRVEVFNL